MSDLRSVSPEKLLGRGVWVCVNNKTDDWEKRIVIKVFVPMSLEPILDNGVGRCRAYVDSVTVRDRGGSNHFVPGREAFLRKRDIPYRGAYTEVAKKVRTALEECNDQIGQLKSKRRQLMDKLSRLSVRRETKG